MDFVRLALREAKRNASRTLIAIFAVALAAGAPVMARVIPHGYPTGLHIEERRFIGGDLVVWRAPAPIDVQEDSPLSWRPWAGSDWQSHALYFLPSLTEGYLASPDAPAWGPVDDAIEALKGVDGIAEVHPYLAAPCVVETRRGPVPAILRGRDPDAAGSPHSISGFIRDGRPLAESDNGRLSALVPLRGGLSGDVSLVGPSLSISVAGTRHVLDPVGNYGVIVGETVDYEAWTDNRHTMPTMPVYWERPEIIVTEATFCAIAGNAPAVYQLSATVTKVSELESTVARARKALGPAYTVYSVPELAQIKHSAIKTPVVKRDLSRVSFGLSFALSGVVVAGSVYILLAQQRRKIGLLRVVGGTRGDVIVYVLAATLYITLVGGAAGFVGGKILALLALTSSDMTWTQWLRNTGGDLLTVAGFSLTVTALLGLAVGLWASRIPCAEVLRRE